MPSPDDRKDEYVRDMFASIAPRYDLLNSLLSFNRHRYWRRFAVGKCELRPGDAALDVGVGTGDLAIELARAVCGRRLQSATGRADLTVSRYDLRSTRDYTGSESEQEDRSPRDGTGVDSGLEDRSPRVAQHIEGQTGGRVVGVDFCQPMLDIAAQKLNRLGIGNVQLIEGNAERLPVPSNSFRAATTGFTLRNVTNIEAALAEMTRAVEPGGRVVVLELAKPQGPVFRRIYDAYFHRLLPMIGGAMSGGRGSYPSGSVAISESPPIRTGRDSEIPTRPDITYRGSDGASPSRHQKRGPYDYLPASVASFVSREELQAVMEKVGLSDVRVYDLTAGIVAVHVGIKK